MVRGSASHVARPPHGQGQKQNPNYSTCPETAPSGLHQLALIEQLNDPNAAPENTCTAAWAFELVGDKFEISEKNEKVSAWQQRITTHGETQDGETKGRGRFVNALVIECRVQ